MHWLIIILIILAVLLFLVTLLLNIVLFFIPIAFITLPAWGVGLVVGVLVLHRINQSRLDSLLSTETLASLVNLNFDGRKLNCSIKDLEVQEYANATSSYALAILTSLGATSLILFLLSQFGVFQGHTFDFGLNSKTTPISEGTVIAWAIVLSIGVIIFGFIKGHSN
jgi:hypothetical protein